MSRGDWLHIASIGGVIALGALAFVGPLVVRVHPEDQGRAASASHQTQQAIQPPASVNAEHQQRTAEERDEADVRAQERMAAAAENAVNLSFWALMGLGGTLAFAYLGWREAKRSADADNKALRLTRRQLRESRNAAAKAERLGRKQARAYVHVSGAWLDFTRQATGMRATGMRDPSADPNEPVYEPVLVLRIENAGQTATTYLSYHVVADQEPSGTVFVPRELPDPGANTFLSNMAPTSHRDVEDQRLQFLQAIEAYQETPRRRPPTTGLLGRLPDYFTVRGRVRYQDVFGKRFESQFGFYCWAHVPGARIRMNPMHGNFPVFQEQRPPGRPTPPEPIPDPPRPPGAVGPP